MLAVQMFETLNPTNYQQNKACLYPAKKQTQPFKQFPYKHIEPIKKDIIEVLKDLPIKKKVVPTRQDIRENFLNGNLDPRNFKSGKIVTLKIQGTNYKVKINEKGEFITKIQGRDDKVRIYVGKNKKGQDCVCYEVVKKHTECNIYSTFTARYPFEKYELLVYLNHKGIVH
ncbi:MAG: hypothetical protein MJ229_07885 [bacterium]|nr:hypothetical protein [bacterium]